jgi:hypothetical protein
MIVHVCHVADTNEESLLNTLINNNWQLVRDGPGEAENIRNYIKQYSPVSKLLKITISIEEVNE